MASIKRMVHRVKDDALAILSPARVTAACVAAQHPWRVRKLDPVTLVGVMMLQVLHATSCRGALRVAGIDLTPMTYCKAKQRIPLEVLQRLVLMLAQRERRVAGQASGDDSDAGRGFRGHRVVMVDGSSASMPDTPALQAVFGQPSGVTAGCGFPVVHLLALFDQASGMILDLLTHRCDTHDMAHTSELHPMLEADDVLLGDRAFCSYAHLCLLARDRLHGVLRLHQKQIVSFKAGRKHKRLLPKAQRAKAPSSRFVGRLGQHDQIVEYFKPKVCPKWMTPQAYAQLPEALTVRELRYKIKAPRGRTREVTLVTTLLDPRKYPKAELAGLYQSRWDVETRLLEFKQTLGANVLRSTSEQGVLKDLWTHVLVFNLIRLLMLRHAKARGVDPRRLSFIDARDVLRHMRDGPGNPRIPRLAYRPTRPGRDEPRVIKRRKDCYTVMARPRETLRQEIENKSLTP